MTFVISLVVQLAVLIFSLVTLGIGNPPPLLQLILVLETVVQGVEFLWYSIIGALYFFKKSTFGVEYRYIDWVVTTPIMLITLFFLVIYFNSPCMEVAKLVDFPGLGTLEAFNTDGLRSLLTSSKAPEMVEKTLRYPGHAEKMRMLRETGFLSSKGVLVASGQAVPRDITEALLFSAWQFEEGEPDLTVMRIVVEGDKEGKTVRHTYELLDYYNTETETSSMARTTGYTCTGMVRLITNGIWDQPGVAPPEIVGRNIECFDAVIEHLKDRKVQVFHSVKEI